MKLYQIPKNSKIYIECTDGSTFIIFKKIDGIYSVCITEKGNITHLGVNIPLIKFEDGYKIE